MDNNIIVIFLGGKLDCLGGKFSPHPPVDETLPQPLARLLVELAGQAF